MNKLEAFTKETTKTKAPEFRVGDSLKIYVRVKEGDKTRTQMFEGICTRRRGTGVSATFAVIKETHGDIVEKLFPLYSPTIEKIVVGRKGKVKRAKLYNLRKKSS